MSQLGHFATSLSRLDRSQWPNYSESGRSTVDDAMPRDGSMTPRDLIGKLDMIRVECAKCDRRGQYQVLSAVGPARGVPSSSAPVLCRTVRLVDREAAAGFSLLRVLPT